MGGKSVLLEGLLDVRVLHVFIRCRLYCMRGLVPDIILFTIVADGC